MQAPLRRWHRVVWVLLTIAVGGALLVSIIGRRPIPIVEELPVPSEAESRRD